MANQQRRRNKPFIDATTEIEDKETMKVVMQKIAAGPGGVAKRGTVLDVSESEGKEMLAKQIARPYDDQRDAKSPRGWVQAADVKK